MVGLQQLAHTVHTVTAHPSDEPYEVADRAMGFDRMTEGEVCTNAVSVSSPHLLPLNKASLFEVGDDPLHRSLRDPHADSHFP